MLVTSRDCSLSPSHWPEGHIQRDLGRLIAFAYEKDPSIGNWFWYSPHAMSFLHAVGGELMSIEADRPHVTGSRYRQIESALKSIAEGLYDRLCVSGDGTQLTPIERDQLLFRARNVVQLSTGVNSVTRQAVPVDRDCLDISRGRLPLNCRGDIALSALEQPAFVLFFSYLREIVRKAIPPHLY